MRGFWKKSTVVIILEAFIIGLLTGLLVLAANKGEARDQPDLITHFDQTDLDRIKEMIARFGGGRGDNLTMIQWGVDSGPFIHDLYSDGRVIRWTVDNTRDGMSSNTGKTEYVCRAMRLDETVEFYSVELSNCEGYAKDETISLISFRKDAL
ncbi:hypothetical protein [Paenibacillus sp. BAC0078]